MLPEGLLEKLIIKNDTKIVYLILDGVGGLSLEGKKGTELQVAHKPNLDKLAEKSICGLLDPIAPGITPGSGPSHFSLFGYDPLESNIGRGILEASGIDFPLTSKDVVARINYATIDTEGRIIDRRAGRITTSDNKRICAKLRDNIDFKHNIDVFIEPVKEHRAVLAFRGEGLHGDIEDTDPQKVGLYPLEPKAIKHESETTAKLVSDFLSQVRSILADEKKANMILLRGFAKHRVYPSMEERFGLKSAAIATYPMYKGIARLLGMAVIPSLTVIEDEFNALKKQYNNYDFFYIHIKQTDSKGEDGDFDAKVKVIEEVDEFLPRITELNPDVLIVTGDHSTPAKWGGHSWHPLPVILHSRFCRVDQVTRFDEISCIQGGLGRQPSYDLMTIALANAGRLSKFGA
ncbi:MAG: 2,3-bisphosphoglycerate-independent phosphoglycerate mutase [Thermodesulfobacteriota bacterium]|nr:2,3-bisphosphoglycerate-independent phosphoglycerate mutase [Thermodesulfobacteriota bacterium]